MLFPEVRWNTAFQNWLFKKELETLREVPEKGNMFVYLLTEFLFGEYQALTMAGCLDHVSLFGSSHKDSSSFLDFQDWTPTTFS